jgi:hypothetical protein
MSRRTRKRRIIIATATGMALMIAAAIALQKWIRVQRLTVVTGAVIAQSKNPHLQRPIGNASVTVTSEAASWKSVSETSGLFRAPLDLRVLADEVLELRVEHPDYHPFAMTTATRDQIYVVRMTPKREESSEPGQQVPITNIRVRYTTRTTTTTTVGTAVRTFDINNKGNVPCAGHPPCSPDGKWKATIRSFPLDTGDQKKQFRNVRVSCIAGPCPFSVIEQDRFSRGGRTVTVSVRNWSDPVTYLLEAEVAQTMESELTRHTWPVTFGQTMNFTLPAVASGLTIEAEVDNSEIAFPLGPQLKLSWATCRFEERPEGAKQYRCELKPGYQFQ